jgi:hypothetical protein
MHCTAVYYGGMCICMYRVVCIYIYIYIYTYMHTHTNGTAVYSEVMLGKSNDEYCAWIQKDQSWGGAIELGILSEHYGVEICAIDVTHVNVYRFGE